MQFTVPRGDLARVLTAVSRAVERRNTIPILAHVLLTVGAEGLSVRGTDLDVEITATVPAMVDRPGSYAIEAMRLADIVKKMAGDSVSVDAADGKVTVKSGRSRFVLPTLPAEDFPDLRPGEFIVEFEIDLAALVAPVQFAMSDEETRYYLNGVHLHSSPEGLVAVATDGHQLAKNVVQPDVPVPAVILPRKAVALLPKGVVKISLSATKIRVAAGEIVLISKLIDGTFPDYGRVVPGGNTKVLTVNRVALAKAADRVAAVTDERTRAVKLVVANDNVGLSVRSGPSEASEGVPGTYSGEPIEIGFNSKYLSNVLGVLQGEDVTLAMSDPGTPGLFRGDGSVFAVIMPMRV